LLLTILTLMKRQGITLPERRVELYDQYVRTLLSSWNRARGLGRPPIRDLDVVETVRILAPLALWMHSVNPGVGLVRSGDLHRKLEEVWRSQGAEDPEQASRRFLQDVRDYVGLLLERGPGQYGFIHLSIEEYLAAVGVARLGQRDIAPIADLLADHVGDSAWREVALLTVGYLGIVQQNEQVASDVVDALLTESQTRDPAEAVVLAGEAVADAWPGGVTVACRERVVTALIGTLNGSGQAKMPQRVRAGQVLARLGDARSGVGLDPETGLPDVVWCVVPPGQHTTDEADDEDTEKLLVSSGFRISRFLVTNSQLTAFVNAGGYSERHFWTGRGWQWKEQSDRNAPRDYGESFKLANHPVVGVSWYEAVAFCRWLTEVWRAEGAIAADEIVRLPTESEWQFAAQGTDGRIYPWGNAFSVDKCNIRRTDINTTTAVGVFPGGASLYGVLDMAGNVWEWCANRWAGDKKSQAEDSAFRAALTSAQPPRRVYRTSGSVSDSDGDGPRVLKGGSWSSARTWAYCASSFGDHPGNWSSDRGFRVLAAPFSSAFDL
jgi:formylglycine-generating enzyme required for sulfatase activity